MMNKGLLIFGGHFMIITAVMGSYFGLSRDIAVSQIACGLNLLWIGFAVKNGDE